MEIVILVFIFYEVLVFIVICSLGRGSNDVLLVKEMCSGSEASLRDCPRQDYHSTPCDHSFDIGLACGKKLADEVVAGDEGSRLYDHQIQSLVWLVVRHCN